MNRGTSIDSGGAAPRLALAFGLIGAASVGVRIVLESVRPSQECGTGFTVAFEWLIWTAIVSAALAIVVGVVALVRGSGRTAVTLAGVGLAIAVGGVMFVPGVATVVCGSS